MLNIDTNINTNTNTNTNTMNLTIDTKNKYFITIDDNKLELKSKINCYDKNDDINSINTKISVNTDNLNEAQRYLRTSPKNSDLEKSYKDCRRENCFLNDEISMIILKKNISEQSIVNRKRSQSCVSFGTEKFKRKRTESISYFNFEQSKKNNVDTNKFMLTQTETKLYNTQICVQHFKNLEISDSKEKREIGSRKNTSMKEFIKQTIIAQNKLIIAQNKLRNDQNKLRNDQNKLRDDQEQFVQDKINAQNNINNILEIAKINSITTQQNLEFANNLVKFAIGNMNENKKTKNEKQ